MWVEVEEGELVNLVTLVRVYLNGNSSGSVHWLAGQTAQQQAAVDKATGKGVLLESAPETSLMFVKDENAGWWVMALLRQALAKKKRVVTIADWKDLANGSAGEFPEED